MHTVRGDPVTQSRCIDSFVYMDMEIAVHYVQQLIYMCGLRPLKNMVGCLLLEQHLSMGFTVDIFDGQDVAPC